MVRRLLVCAFLLGVIAWTAAACSDGKTYSADRFDVDLAMLPAPDGPLVVTETVDFRFEGGPFTYVFRDLAYTEIDEIDRLQASMDGQVLPQGSGPGQVEIEAGDPLKVTWHFTPTSDSTHTFSLVYRVQGAVRQLDDADALIWRAIPEEHEYEIASSTITLSYPKEPVAMLLSEPRVLDARAVVEMGDGQAALLVHDIDADQELIVEAHFAPGSLVSAPPAWQVAQAERSRQTQPALALGLSAGLLTAVIGGGLLAGYWRRYGRRQALASATPFKLTDPPSQAPPAVAAKLVNSGNPALAAMFDLAQRGALRIDETPGRWGRSFILGRQPAAGTLKPHEQGLLDALFQTKSGFDEQIPLSQVATRLASHSKQFNRPLEEEMALAGLLDRQHQAQRSRFIAVGVMTMLLGGVGFGLGMIWSAVVANNAQWTIVPIAAGLAGVGAGLFVVGFIGIIAGTAFSTLTVDGEREAGAWRGFAAYLKDVARGKETLLDMDLFDRYLPYAAGFGLGELWTKRFQKQSGLDVPDWFHALQADDDGWTAYVAMMAATNSSFGSAGAGGAAGASGGGASGAG